MDPVRQRSLNEHYEMEEVAKDINKKLKSDAKKIFSVILKLSAKQKKLVKSKYRQLFKQLLETDLKNNLSGEFQDLMLALMQDPYEYECSFMNEAISGIGEDENLICELLCSKSAGQIRKLNNAYQEMYGRSMEDDIKSQAKDDGDFNGFYLTLAKGLKASNHGYDLEDAKKDAQTLADAIMEKKKGKSNDQVIIKILCQTSFSQLFSTFAFFKEITKTDIEEVVKEYLSGNMKLASLTIIKCVQNKPAYFAELFHYCLSGFGTQNTALNRLIVTRSDKDLESIKTEYKRIYGETLYHDIKSDTSGEYQKAVLTILESSTEDDN